MKNYTDIFLSSAVMVLFDQVLFSGANFLITIFLAKTLHPENFGLFSSIVIVTFLALSVSNAFIIQPFQVSYSKTEAKNQYLSFLLISQLVLLFLISLIIAIGCLVMNSIEDIHVNVFFIILFIVGYLFQDFYRKLLLGLEKIKLVIWVDVLYILLVFIGFFYFQNAMNLKLSLGILGIANILSALPAIFFSVKEFQFPTYSSNWFKMHCKQGQWLISVAFLQWSASNFFVLLSGIYLGVQALGAFRLVQSIFGIINIILQTVENYFIPKIAKLWIQNSIQAKKYLLQLSFTGFLLFGLLLVFLFFNSKSIIILFGGAQYENYHFVIKMMAILYVFIFLSYPIRIEVRVQVLNKIFFTGYALSFMSSIITFHYLLQHFALKGAIIGLLINQIIMIVYWYLELNRKKLTLWK